MSDIRLEGVSKRYGAVAAADDVGAILMPLAPLFSE